MSRLHVVHTTRFVYDGPVTASYNEARMTPLSERGQTVLESRLAVEPQTWRHDYRDYWGTAVAAFESGVPHRELVLESVTRVDVGDRTVVADATWEQVRDPATVAELGEFLAPSATTRAPDDVAATAAELAAELGPDATARAVALRLHELVEYVPGVTAVHSTAADAWEQRKGVCQDLAHLTVAALRSAGVPARYVSGYLHPLRGGDVGLSVVGESHAWVEWWAGDWVAFDPTNGTDVGEHHVVIGRGREYQDVAPVRGTYAGGGTRAHEVTVQITREA
ncbi:MULTISPECIES: transglutaminase family protein [unclassified Actinotalea]|uniref:transglutaminase family protein n=1 Tax=unclassified Actinotalea TaxID=2638618 RepID=UPI0015F6711D|nr:MULTISPECIES: transglutaminase family protein [unclassified Actinotalea]